MQYVKHFLVEELYSIWIGSLSGFVNSLVQFLLNNKSFNINNNNLNAQIFHEKNKNKEDSKSKRKKKKNDS